MYSTEMKNKRTPTNWFDNMCTHSQNWTDPNVPYTLEIAYLLGCGASPSVRKNSTPNTGAQVYNVCYQYQKDTSKTLTYVNQAEFPML